jgi:hypothetical protein
VPAAADYDSIEWGRVRRLIFVPFLDDGRCALVPAGGRLVLPSGEGGPLMRAAVAVRVEDRQPLRADRYHGSTVAQAHLRHHHVP